jgi:hypothetical protein
MTADELKKLITDAFAEVERPGNWALRGSDEGTEPYLVEKEFADKSDWRTVDAAFLDQAPDGFSSALSFLSDEAFRYFLPAYLIADIDGKLQTADPCFHLWHGLEDKARATPLNPRRYGARTWFEAMSHKHSTFRPAEAAAIVAYLRFRSEGDPFRRDEIEQAIRNFWAKRAEGR